jgi:hypothetical protein
MTNPFSLAVVDSKKECECGICIAGSYTVVNSCKRHGVSRLVVSDDEFAEETKGYCQNTHGVILATLTYEDYD